jgi:hypothetical protein
MAKWFLALLLLPGVSASAQQAPQPPAPPPGGLHAADVLMNLSSDMETLAHAVEPAVVKIYSSGLLTDV